MPFWRKVNFCSEAKYKMLEGHSTPMYVSKRFQSKTLKRYFHGSV